MNTINTFIPTYCVESFKKFAYKRDATAFYALVKDIRHGKIILNRATKNPKKGMSVVTI